MQIEHKIEKLLALAGNNPSQEEAEAAMLKAQQLLLENGLTEGDLPREQDTARELDLCREGRRATWWQRSMATVVAKNFRCFVFTRRGPQARRLILVGLSRDLESARRVYDFAVASAAREAKRYLAARKQREPNWSQRLARGLRNDFLRGFLDGLAQSFQESIADTGSALLLVRPTAVDDHLNKLGLRSPGRQRTLTAGCGDARSSGSDAGSGFVYREPLE